MNKDIVPADNLPSVRDSVLLAAGLDDDRLSSLLADAIETMHRHTRAKKITRTTYKGKVVEVHEDDDAAIQLKAAALLADFSVSVAGLKRDTENKPGRAGPISVNITLPSGQDLVKDVTPDNRDAC